jgi:alkyl hydroperoxide reductase subunit D
MSVDAIIDALPNYAKDLKLNYSSLVRQNTELTPQQLWGTVVATTLAARSAPLTAAVLAEATGHLDPKALEAAQSAAAIMAMNNIFYRFHHLSSNDKYPTMPARLRMNAIRTHGVDALDFELWCLAVSAVNGCGKCVDAHEKVIRDKGASEELVMAAVRIASVIHAIASVLDAESAAPAAQPAEAEAVAG